MGSYSDSAQITFDAKHFIETLKQHFNNVEQIFDFFTKEICYLSIDIRQKLIEPYKWLNELITEYNKQSLLKLFIQNQDENEDETTAVLIDLIQTDLARFLLVCPVSDISTGSLKVKINQVFLQLSFSDKETCIKNQRDNFKANLISFLDQDTITGLYNDFFKKHPEIVVLTDDKQAFLNDYYKLNSSTVPNFLNLKSLPGIDKLTADQIQILNELSPEKKIYFPQVDYLIKSYNQRIEDEERQRQLVSQLKAKTKTAIAGIERNILANIQEIQKASSFIAIQLQSPLFYFSGIFNKIARASYTPVQPPSKDTVYKNQAIIHENATIIYNYLNSPSSCDAALRVTYLSELCSAFNGTLSDPEGKQTYYNSILTFIDNISLIKFLELIKSAEFVPPELFNLFSFLTASIEGVNESAIKMIQRYKQGVSKQSNIIYHRPLLAHLIRRANEPKTLGLLFSLLNNLDSKDLAELILNPEFFGYFTFQAWSDPYEPLYRRRFTHTVEGGLPPLSDDVLAKLTTLAVERFQLEQIAAAKTNFNKLNIFRDNSKYRLFLNNLLNVMKNPSEVEKIKARKSKKSLKFSDAGGYSKLSPGVRTDVGYAATPTNTKTTIKRLRSSSETTSITTTATCTNLTNDGKPLPKSDDALGIESAFNERLALSCQKSPSGSDVVVTLPIVPQSGLLDDSAAQIAEQTRLQAEKEKKKEVDANSTSVPNPVNVSGTMFTTAVPLTPEALDAALPSTDGLPTPGRASAVVPKKVEPSR